MCVDGVYVPICGHSVTGVGSLTDVAQYVCYGIGYYGELKVVWIILLHVAILHLYLHSGELMIFMIIILKLLQYENIIYYW